MKKILLSGFFIVTFISYCIYSSHKKSDIAVILPKGTNPTSIPLDSPTQEVQTTDNPTSTSIPLTPSPIPSLNTPTPKRKSPYNDGKYTGDSTDAFYGNVQVQVTISNGKITDVQFLDYPHDRGTSIEINNQAMPYLKQEAIQAQNAQVDIVSGATQTSEAFMQSLQSALVKAKA